MGVVTTPKPCAECGFPTPGKRNTGLFCSSACRTKFHNLMATRGKVAMPLALVWRRGKHGSSENARWAMREMCALFDRWNAEDAAHGRLTDAVMTAKREGGWLACDLR
jgi:hypothetical protein